MLRIELSQDDMESSRKLVLVNIEKFNRIFQRGFAYIPNGINEELREFEDIKDHFKTGLPIDASTVVVHEDHEKSVADFIDGRHRYCYL